MTNNPGRSKFPDALQLFDLQVIGMLHRKCSPHGEKAHREEAGQQTREVPARKKHNGKHFLAKMLGFGFIQ